MYNRINNSMRGSVERKPAKLTFSSSEITQDDF